MQKTARLKKFARHLLATTCLTVAATGAAQATTVNESTDFGDTFATSNILPVGTDVINGAIFGSIAPDGADFFTFTNLLGGSAFTLGASTPVGSFFPEVQVLTSANTVVSPQQGFSLGSPASANGIVPLDGILVVQVNGNEGSGPYTVTLDAQSAAPEPSTLFGAGLGLAGAFALRRKRKA